MVDKTHQSPQITAVEWILYSTAFAAGAVDIISFVNLGGVFASAMTGNLALLAFHVAQGNSGSAIGSVIALLGFVTGCVIGFRLRRDRETRQAINLLLCTETALLLVVAGIAAACCSLWSEYLTPVATARLQIVILAIAMGLQAVVGQMTALSTIVFTTTLTRLVGGIHDAIVVRDAEALKDVRIQLTLLASYVIGALLAGVLAVNNLPGVVFVPPAAVAVAIAAHTFGRRVV